MSVTPISPPSLPRTPFAKVDTPFTKGGRSGIMVALCGGCRRVKGFHFLVNEGEEDRDEFQV